MLSTMPKRPTLPTARIPALSPGEKFEIVLVDTNIALLFDLLARLAREKKKIIITVE